MVVYNAITIACLVLMVAGLLSVVINLFCKKRAERILYLRTFKKGKSALIYLFAIPLYWIANVYAGDTVFNSFFVAVRRLGELIILRYDITAVNALAQASPLYNFTMYFCFILVTLNALLFAVSIVGQMLWSSFGNGRFKSSSKDKLILFGNNEQNQMIYASDNSRVKVIVDKIEGEDALSLYLKNVLYASTPLTEKYVEKTVANCLKGNQTFVVVVNTQVEEKNIAICRSFIQQIASLTQDQRLKCFEQLKIFVFGDPRFELIYGNIVEDSLGCISLVNKYQEIATDCVNRYPFSQFMDQRHIDYNTSLVREGVDINAFFIGFGKTNQQIFLTSVANNQFVTQTENGVGVKKVQYHIFDKNSAKNNKNLNHNYNRYKNELANANPKDYLPLPDYPAQEHFYQLDINDVAFYNNIHKVASKNHNDVNFVYVAFGQDLENVDMAEKLLAKFKEWGNDNVHIFVKVRDDHQGQQLLQSPNCHVIGNDRQVVYNVDNILGDDVFKMAQMRNAVYDIEYEITQDASAQLTEQRILQIKAQAYKNWYFKKSQMERNSSIYCCLSLRSKLHLMGLDYCKVDANDKQALTEKQYLDIYAHGDMPDFDYYNLKADGKPLVRYTLNFAPSRRRNLAIHEHLRWNSFMISSGIIPATIEQILTEKNASGRYTNGKNYSVRRHGNITTFDGLLEFRKIIANRDKKTDQEVVKLEELQDVIKYDYQLLDDAFWLLTKNGFKIVKK